jgi:peptidoglycan-associated lipoprotein
MRKRAGIKHERNEMKASYIEYPLALAFGGLLLLGCSSKPKPAVAQEPSAPEMSAQPSHTAQNGNADDDARRQRMAQRAKEAFQTIYFPYDQATLDEKAKATLANVRAFLTEYPEVSVSVQGHADERGTTEYNLALGEQRANTVATYLSSLGVPKSNLNTMSYGEEKPAQEGHLESTWRLNRRAEFAPAL